MRLKLRRAEVAMRLVDEEGVGETALQIREALVDRLHL